MLFNYLDYLCYGTIVFAVLAMACASCAYYADAERPEGDPKKRHYALLTVLLAPVLMPVNMLRGILVFLVKVLFVGLFLILFPIALIGTRETVLLKSLRKGLAALGSGLLNTNTTLFKSFEKPRPDNLDKQTPPMVWIR